jgi:hypothetical protein
LAPKKSLERKKRDKRLRNRVTRLGEFFTFGRLFSSGNFLKLLKDPTCFCYSLQLTKLYINFDPKRLEPYLWAIFSQTPLVTLLRTNHLLPLEAVAFAESTVAAGGRNCITSFLGNLKLSCMHNIVFATIFRQRRQIAIVQYNLCSSYAIQYFNLVDSKHLLWFA